MKSYKEETKLLLSKTLIMFETQLSHLEQDENHLSLSDRERRGLKEEKKELLDEMLNIKNCFHWVNSMKQ